MSMNYLDFLTYHDISKDGEEGEDGRESRFAVYDPERNVVDLESIGQVAYTCTACVGVRYDYNFMPAIDELARQLIDVTFYSTWLGKEVVADHGNIVGHFVRVRGITPR